MFKEWDFLLAEIWVLLVLAALIGLIAGWLIWGRRPSHGTDAGLSAGVDDLRRRRAQLDRAKPHDPARLDDPIDDLPDVQGNVVYSRPVPKTPPLAKPAPTPVEIPAAPVPTPAAKPAALEGPRDGLPDDLTKIKGIGAKMETLCNALGFWHYDQIASWTAQEIAWVDDNLEGFKGRVSRDKWVDQAKAYTATDTPTFVRRTD